ncbi:MAG: hypothetical protein U9R57_09240 [Thermodesulfobacteriota bacterium]|nr:hypothetical protein [Thermodesulfobacteriota bacterium]
MTKSKIFFIWLFGSILLMLMTSVISMLVWHFTYHPEPNIQWKPIDSIFDMAYRVPVGWFLSFMTPFGWANILFLGISIFTKWPYLLIGSAIATLLSGLFWPTIYVTMRGL